MKNGKIILLSVTIVLSVIMLFLALILTHIVCVFHEWLPATCVQAQVCKFCGIFSGEPLGHDWADATCEMPKTCMNCSITEGLPASHNWNVATCTQPETCRNCGVTQGEKVEHKPGKITVSSNIVYGYYIEKQVCETCGTSLQNKTINYSSFIKDGKLICTPYDLMERVEDALDGIAGCTLTAGTKIADGDLYGVVWNSSGKAIFAATFLGTGTDNVLTSALSNDLRGYLGYLYDSDSLAYVLLAMVRAIDPSLNFDEGKQMAQRILAAAGTGDEYEANGIRYMLTKYDGKWVFGFTVI